MTTARSGDPCGYGPCGRPDTRLYAEGPRCPAHTPAARDGLPEPDAKRYCLAICYCKECGTRAVVTPIRDTVIDLDHVRSGKRRATPAARKNAQLTPRDR